MTARLIHNSNVNANLSNTTRFTLKHIMQQLYVNCVF